MKNRRYPVLLLCLGLSLLSACDGDSQPFTEAVEVRSLNLVSVAVVPPLGSVNDIYLNIGQPLQLRLEGRNVNGAAVSLTAGGRSWAVSNTDIATIDSNGLLRARANGEVSVSVQLGGLVSEPFPVVVSDATLTAIQAITGPDSLDPCRPGEYYATGLFSDDTVRSLSNAAWALANTDGANGRVVATDAGSASLTGLNASSLTLTAIAGVIRESIAVEVKDSLQTLRITPSPAGVDIDDTLELLATGTYLIDGSAANPSAALRQFNVTDAVDWAIVTGTDYATVSNLQTNKGIVTGVADGSALARASCGNVADDQVIVVSDPSSTSTDSSDVLTFNVSSPYILQRSNTAGFRLQVSTGDSYLAENDVSDSVVWSLDSQVTTTAPISLLETGVNAGLIRPNAEGTSVVTATLISTGAEASITVQVTNN